MTKAQLRNMRVGDTVSDGDNFGDVAMCSFGYVAINWHGVNPKPLPPVVYTDDVFLFLFGDYSVYRGQQ